MTAPRPFLERDGHECLAKGREDKSRSIWHSGSERSTRPPRHNHALAMRRRHVHRYSKRYLRPYARKSALVSWLNEIFPTRLLVAFACGLAAVILWKSLEGLIG